MLEGLGTRFLDSLDPQYPLNFWGSYSLVEIGKCNLAFRWLIGEIRFLDAFAGCFRRVGRGCRCRLDTSAACPAQVLWGLGLELEFKV